LLTQNTVVGCKATEKFRIQRESTNYELGIRNEELGKFRIRNSEIEREAGESGCCVDFLRLN
jgi:hypothetical protein